MNTRKRHFKTHRGIALIAAMIFVAVFAALSVGFLSVSSANTQIASNHRDGNNALNAALSGLDCAMYAVRKASTTSPIKTGTNFVTTAEATQMWNKLCTQMQTTKFGNVTVPNATAFTDSGGTGMRIFTPNKISCQTGGSFNIYYYRYNSAPFVIWIKVTGTDGGVTRSLKMKLDITKDASVMNYALAGRGRMWITGDTTIHGSIYSSWDNTDLSPFNMTSDSRVEGTINTVMEKNTVIDQSWQLEALDADGNPMFDEDGNRVYTSDDEIQGYHEGVNYGQPDQEAVPGLKIGDYNTSAYKAAIGTTTRSGTASVIANGVLGKTGVSTVTEYYPHAAGSYTTRASSSSLSLTRYKYENKTLRNVTISSGTNAVFKNCTFEEVLYVDCGTTTSSYNNVRFENCTFNGPIITNTPQTLNWQKNCLYFTGSATFNNTSSIQEATILAPHFNVNLGNNNSSQNDNNVLTGAIIGGIVDIRGNAEIYGTVISMADTSAYASGYVTNIGATLLDGGSETVEIGDIGTIEITPDPTKLLPSGITTPIILKPQAGSYQECI
jgi:Tfp pilus assembly protein PilX